MQARRAPARVRWSVGDTVLGVGEGSLSVPAGTRTLRAEDLRRRIAHDVPVVDGVVDYGALPTGNVLIVRAGPKARVLLGDDDVTTVRRLPLPVGRYRFRVVRPGQTKEIPVEVAARRDVTLDASR